MGLFVFSSEGNSRALHSYRLSVVSVFRPFDVFRIKLEEREGGEVIVLTLCYFLEYLQPNTSWEGLDCNISVDYVV